MAQLGLRRPGARAGDAIGHTREKGKKEEQERILEFSVRSHGYDWLYEFQTLEGRKVYFHRCT